MRISLAKLKLLFVSMVALGLTACGSFYKVDSQYISNDAEVKKPEILETNLYKKEIKSVKTIAVQAPDKCTQDTSSDKRGQVKKKESIIVSVCGDSLSDIERGLVKAGYQVISWKQFDAEQRQNGLTPREAALKLKTDAIFLINSLDTSEVKLGEDARFERRFFKTNDAGKKKGPALVNDNEKKMFLAHIRPLERRLRNSKRLSATVNATVMMAESGQSIWFYEWTATENREINTNLSVMLDCDESIAGTTVSCVKTTPDESQGFIAWFMSLFSPRTENMSSGDSEAITTGQRSANQQKAEWDKLLGKVIENLLENFKA